MFIFWVDMDFKNWVQQQGGVDYVAKKLDEKPRTVRSWMYQERAPSAKAAVKIVSLSPLDFNALYSPYLVNHSKKQG